MSLRVKCNLSTDLAILKLWCNGQKFGREHVTSGTKRERLDVCGGAQSSQLKPQACARARACFCVPLPTRPLQIDTFGLATGVTRQDWGIQGFPPSWAKMWCLCLLMFMWCAFMVLCTVTKTQILLWNHGRHHRRVSNLRHNQIVMMHLSIQRQSIAGYTVTSVRPSRQRKALYHLCAFFSPVLEPCVKKHWKGV